ncbi:hypothetical protein J6590_002984 [Homalodisca vitripennis]|nr:hypothetical protein J6590_002984 [Homalodisca vitripennis]
MRSNDPLPAGNWCIYSIVRPSTVHYCVYFCIAACARMVVQRLRCGNVSKRRFMYTRRGRLAAADVASTHHGIKRLNPRSTIRLFIHKVLHEQRVLLESGNRFQLLFPVPTVETSSPKPMKNVSSPILLPGTCSVSSANFVYLRRQPIFPNFSASRTVQPVMWRHKDGRSSTPVPEGCLRPDNAQDGPVSVSTFSCNRSSAGPALGRGLISTLSHGTGPH